MQFEPGQLLHGTTVEASLLIEASRLVPMRGEFINKMYGSADDDAPGLPGVFFSNPNDSDGIWGAANAMRDAIARQLNKDWHEVSLDDVAIYGAMVVVSADKDLTWKYNEDGSSTSLRGFVNHSDPAAGTEPGDYYSFELHQSDSVIKGMDLVVLVKSVRRYGDDGSYLFTNTQADEHTPDVRRLEGYSGS